MSEYAGVKENSDLRKMSEYAGVKEIHDLCYNCIYGFVHITRGSRKESYHQKFLNRLNIYHQIHQHDHPLIPNVIFVSVEIVNKKLECINILYSSFHDLIKRRRVVWKYLTNIRNLSTIHNAC